MIKGMKLLVAGAVVVALTACANATAILTVYDGVNPLISVFDNGPGDGFPVLGEILVQTNIGVWNLDINLGVTKPLFGSAAQPVMDLSVSATSTATGSLHVVFSDNGFTGPVTGTLNATETGHVVTGAAVNVAYAVYTDPGNVAGALTTQVVNLPSTPFPTSETSSGALTITGSASLSEAIDFAATGATTISSDSSFNVTPVPEPGVLALGSLAMVAGAFATFQRRRA